MMAPDDRSGLSLADVGDIVCCILLIVFSVMTAIEFAGVVSYAWRYLGVALSPLMG